MRLDEYAPEQLGGKEKLTTICQMSKSFFMGIEKFLRHLQSLASCLFASDRNSAILM
jgi:hypothetical protein